MVKRTPCSFVRHFLRKAKNIGCTPSLLARQDWGLRFGDGKHSSGARFAHSHPTVTGPNSYRCSGRIQNQAYMETSKIQNAAQYTGHLRIGRNVAATPR